MISTLAGEKFRNKLLAGHLLTEAEIVAGISSVEDEATFMALAAKGDCRKLVDRIIAAVEALPSMPMLAGPWHNASEVDAVLLPAVLDAIRKESER